MTRCPKCGQDSPDQARFCRFCGNRLGTGVNAEVVDPDLTPEQRAQRLLEEAFRLSEQGRVLAAIQTCQQALALNSNSTSAHSLLGTLYQRQGNREQAIREFEQVLTLSPESTVERRLLNELMGVPTASQPTFHVSPKVARFTLTGAAGVVAVAAILALVLGHHPAPEPAPAPAKPAARPTSNALVVQDTQPVRLPAPGVVASGPIYAPIPPMPGKGPAAPPAFSAPSGPVIIPATGADRYFAGAGPSQLPVSSGPIQYFGAPVVTAAGANGLPSGAGWSPQSGRDYYLQGDYSRAAQTYRNYLTTAPSAGGAPREELGWVYLQMGQRDLATQQYKDALSNYRDDLRRGNNVEAARHGVRTCQSAIRALETR